MRWAQGADLSKLSGEPVRLRFALRDADLYAFRFAGIEREKAGAGQCRQGATREKRMEIRHYRPSDLETLKTITAICFEGVSIDQNIEKLYGLIDGKDWKWRKKRHIDADAEIHAPGILVAEADGQVVGYISTRIDPATKVGRHPQLCRPARIPEAGHRPQTVGGGGRLPGQRRHALRQNRDAGPERGGDALLPQIRLSGGGQTVSLRHADRRD